MTIRLAEEALHRGFFVVRCVHGVRLMETEQPARGPDAGLQLDPAIEIERISGFIRDEVRRRGARGVVIGLSGGLDSTTCAYLCRRSLPAKQIHLLSLPERDSSAAPRGHAQSVARALGLPLEEQNLSELFGRLGLYEQVPPEVAGNRPLLERSIGILRRLSRSPALYPWAQEYAFGRRRGLLAGLVRRWLWRYPGMTAAFIFGKVRARALALSIKAMQMDCLLVCTTDRSEWSVGFYDPARGRRGVLRRYVTCTRRRSASWRGRWAWRRKSSGSPPPATWQGDCPMRPPSVCPMSSWTGCWQGCRWGWPMMRWPRRPAWAGRW